MPPLLFRNATLLDCTGADPIPHASVLVEHGRIARVSAVQFAPPGEARVIDCTGRTLMPGLTDAHVHLGLVAASANDPPESYVSYVLKVLENLRIAIDEGFTTVRDAGNLDPAYAVVVDAGHVAGPRILPAGSFLSITGGHGDQRSPWSDEHARSIPGLVAHSEIVDGVDAVRAAARRQIRRGATQVKLMASGGVMSPNDPLESLQFSVSEMTAAVEEARAFGTYVMAHCHTPGAIANALDAGVRSIEHGSILDDTTARRMADCDAYLVPTVVILEILARAHAIPEFSRRKLEMVRSEVAGSVDAADRAGVHIGSGSDLLGPRQQCRASEIAEKARLLGPMRALISATKTNAELFGLDQRIGTVEEGKDADLILVNGDPLNDINVVVAAANIPFVVKGGVVMKDLVGG